MIDKKRLTTISISGTIIFLITYGYIASFYVQKFHNRYASQIQVHARIISSDVWNINSTGMKAYLQLAVQTEHFRELEVFVNDEKEVFLKVVAPPLSGLDKFLYTLHLIQIKELFAVIKHEGQKIGEIRGKKYMRIFYPLLTIFIFQIFSVLTILFILYLFLNRRFLEQEVKERTRRYHELVNLLPEIVLETDADGKIVFANEIAIQQFNFTELARDERKLHDLLEIIGGDKSYEHFISFILGKNLDQNEYMAKRDGDSSFPVLVRSAPIVQDNQISGARIILVDITEQRALKEQLNRDQKMKFIGLMAGGVAHDLNNILSGLINYPELILLQLSQDSELRNYVEPMKEAGLRAAAVVADLLMIARGIAAPRTIENIDDLIGDFLQSPEFQQLENSNPNFSYTTQCTSRQYTISCSVIHVKKCLMNLITNGVEAMSGIGCITISTAFREINSLKTPYGEIPKGCYIVLSIKDEGPGITTSNLENIFEPFYSKKEMGRSGTGLGLAIVLNILQDHNGGVTVQTSEKGTAFSLYFPSSNQAVISVSNNDCNDSYRGNGEAILIIDDELQQRDIAQQFLFSLGYQPKAVSSGEEAVEYLHENTVDLLLLDMIIGSGLNGKETYEKILQIHPQQRAIIISGYSDSDDVKGAMKLGAGALINKPYTKDILAKSVFQELRRPRPPTTPSV